MRFLLFILGISVGVVAIGNRAEAQHYPWCAMLNKGVNCVFVNFEQCMAYVRGIGGYCTPNNTFQPPPRSHPSTRVYRRYPY
jgi:Protein of unknown function (DUF3551)